MHSNMKLRVKRESGSFQLNNALLQGEVCSPLLFSLYTEDIETHLLGNDIGM